MTASILMHVGAEFNKQVRIEFFVAPCVETTQALNAVFSASQSLISGNRVFSAVFQDGQSVLTNGYIEVSPETALDVARSICEYLKSVSDIQLSLQADPDQAQRMAESGEFDEFTRNDSLQGNFVPKASFSASQARHLH